MILPKYFSRNTIIYSPSVVFNDHVGIVVVIPAFKEDDLFQTLESLDLCDDPGCSVAVIIVNNLPEYSTDNDKNTQLELNNRIRQFNFNSSYLSIFPIEAFDLPSANFGAGLARKIGMDLAAYLLFTMQKESAVIVSLDADCVVAKSYFVEIFKAFREKRVVGVSIYFEHPLHGELPQINYSAIAQYELHLRYYNLMLKSIGFPNAFHTVGSSFAVRASSYVLAGGMTKKIAGEDFYFIQKLLSMGNYCEINSTTVYPSARLSSRVLFGTGAAVTKFVNNSEQNYFTFNPEAFQPLKELYSVYSIFYLKDEMFWEDEIFYRMTPILNDFFKVANISSLVVKLKANCSSLKVFQSRFFLLFDGLLIVRYLNYAHEKHFAKVKVNQAAIAYLQSQNIVYGDNNCSDLLWLFRNIERVQN